MNYVCLSTSLLKEKTLVSHWNGWKDISGSNSPPARGKFQIAYQVWHLGVPCYDFPKKKLIFNVIIYSAEGETFKNCRWNRRSFGIKEIFATWNGFWTSEDHFLFSSWLIQLNDISCRVVPPEFLIKCNQQNLLFHQAEALVKIYAFSWKSQWYWLSCGSLDQIPRFIF